MNSKVFYFIWTFSLFTLGLQAQNIVIEDHFDALVSNCNDNAPICVDIALEDLQNYSITSNNQSYSGSVSGCNFDTLINYNYNSLFGQGEMGPYMLNQWIVNGSAYSGEFQDIPDLVSQMNLWDPQGNWVQIPSNTEIFGGVTGGQYGTMDITAIATGQPSLIGLNFNISAQGVTFDFSSGQHEVIVTDLNTTVTDTFTVSVVCQTNPVEMMLNLYPGESETVCFDLSELTSDPALTMNICTDNGTDAVDFGLIDSGSCVEINATSVGQDIACFVVCDDANNCDTTQITVNVLSTDITETYYFEDEIPANQEVYQICLDTMELLGNVVSIENICPEESGAFVSFTIDESNYCVKYSGLECDGTETACIVICDDTNICDTTFLTIHTDNSICQPQPEYINNTIYQTQSFEYCFNTNDLPGTLSNIENVCEGTDNVSFILNEETFCVTYTGIYVGQDNACIVVTDDLGNTDTTYFNINVITPQIEVITDVILLDETMTYCLDNSELPGNTFAVYNICEESSGENVNFQIDPVSLCIDAEALSIGTDTACIVICDENMICDTTFYYITVEEDANTSNNIPPIAVDDIFNSTENSPTVLNILGNDTIPSGSQIVVYILPTQAGGSGPLNGTAVPNQDGTITYTPTDNFCGTDQFDYVLCNQFGCDTALVVINIECDMISDSGIHIYNGFSPNDDNVNDNFTVQGLENHPNNNIVIYNRWGNEVFKAEAYRNDWNGMWRGKVLPDGTYFYLLTVDGFESFTGYVEIKR